jgi:hypothetical protein
MKIIITTLLSLLTIILVSVVFLFGYTVSAYNTANTLKISYEAKISANQADFDNMKKVISQSAEVSDVQFQKLQEIFVSYADARTDEASGALMRWVQESVPNVDTQVMTNLQNIIVAQRNGWTSRQKELVDISREFNGMLVRFPSNFLLGSIFGMKKIDPLVITSTSTQETFQTGLDDDKKLF